MNDDNGIVECRIQGTSITTDMLGEYLRAWSRHGIRFHTGKARHAAPLHADVLTYRFSYSHPDPALRGELNPHFLNPDTCARSLPPASDFPGGCVILSVPHIASAEDMRFAWLLEKLDGFLAGLPAVHRYAVGVQNPEYLLPEYFACLRRHAVAHLFMTSPELPDLLEQAQWPYALTADVACVLTVPALDADWQLGMMELIRRCIDAGRVLHVFAAGSHSSTISLAVLMERMNGDLARLSPIRTAAA